MREISLLEGLGRSRRSEKSPADFRRRGALRPSSTQTRLRLPHQHGLPLRPRRMGDESILPGHVRAIARIGYEHASHEQLQLIVYQAETQPVIHPRLRGETAGAKYRDDAIHGLA